MGNGYCTRYALLVTRFLNSMSRLFMIAQALPFGLSRSQEREVRRTPLMRQEQWALVFLIMSVVVGVVYLFIVNSLATAGFRLKERTAHMRSLTDKNTVLTEERERLRSWDAIVARLPELHLVEATRVDYVTVEQPVAFIQTFTQ